MVESILGTGFDLSGAKTAAKLDSLAMEAYSLKRNGPVFSFRASPRHKVSLVRVPATTSDRSFRGNCEWLDKAAEINGSKDGTE